MVTAPVHTAPDFAVKAINIKKCIIYNDKSLFVFVVRDYFANFAFDCTGLGLLVFLEIVHSYAAADEMVGLSLFDGSNDCFFRSGTCSYC